MINKALEDTDQEYFKNSIKRSVAHLVDAAKELENIGLDKYNKDILYIGLLLKQGLDKIQEIDDERLTISNKQYDDILENIMRIEI